VRERIVEAAHLESKAYERGRGRRSGKERTHAPHGDDVLDVDVKEHKVDEDVARQSVQARPVRERLAPARPVVGEVGENHRVSSTVVV
jgi:hypothetical protein